MSSQAQQSSEAENSGSHSSARGAIPSHPVEINDSDMDEASRSVSPEPYTQQKAASQGVAGRTQSNLSNSTYPPGYSADGIPPEISPVLLTDKVTPTERVAIVEHQPFSTESASTDLQQDSAIQHPTALKAAVPSRTDHGIADASTEGITNSQSESQPQPSTPSSPSKSSSFFSRVLGSFMPGSTPAASETSEQGRYLQQAPSASWGKSPESEAVEEVRQAGTFRSNESGLDEPTATKQAGLESGSGGSNYGRSSPTTAVAAAESLADTKAGAHHDTAAAAGRYAPQSPGRSESEYYGTPQASPDKGSSQYAEEDVNRTAQHTTHGNQSGQSQGYNQSQGASQNYSNPQGQSYGSDSVSQGEGTGVVDKLKAAVGMGSSTTEAGSQASNQGYNQGASQGSNQDYSSGTNQGYSQGGNQGYTQGSNQGFSSGRPAWATAATSSAPVSEQAPSEEHKYGQPYGQSDMARSLSAAQGSREYDNTDSFKTAPSSESYGGHQADTATGSTGIVGTVLHAVGLGGGDDTVTPTATHTQRDSSPTRSPGVFEQLKDAVGLGNSNANTAVGGTSEHLTSQPAAATTQEHKYGQPYGESEMARSLSSAQPSTGYTGSSQQQGQGTGVLDKLKSAVGVGSGTTAQTEGTNQGYSQGNAERFSSSRPAWATSGTIETAVSQPAASQERNYGQAYGESDSSRSLSSAQPTGGYTGSAQSQGQGTGVVDKLKSAVGVGSGSSTGTGTGTESYSKDYSQARPAVATAPASETPGSGQEHKYGQPYGESEMFQKLSAAQQSKQDNTSSDQYTRPNTGYTDGSNTQGQGTGFVDKLKSAVGIGSNTTDSTEAVTGSGFSASSNPIYDSDTPRSGAGYQSTRTLQPAPPSASWGTAKTSYAPTAGISQGGDSSGVSTGAAGTASQSAYLGSAASGAAATGSEGAYSGNKVDSSNYQGNTPAQDSGTELSKELPAKGSLFGGKGRALEQPSQAPSTGSPKATEGIRGKTPVQESSKAFTEEVPSGTSAGQGTSTGQGISSGQGVSTGQGTSEAAPAKLGTTASTRSPGSPMTRTGAAADQSAGQAGQPEPPVVLGTTVFEHALARTSGVPLSRVSGTPSSPPSSFKRQPGAGAAGVASGGSTAMQGSGRTTSELPVSTNAPPASARSTQESPAEAAAAARPSQGITQPTAIKEEPIAEGKSQLTEGKASGSKGLTEGSMPVTEGNKALAEEKKAASTVTPQGATGTTIATEKRAAGATQPSSAAAQPAGAAKKQSGIAGCFACFSGQSAKE